METNYFGFGGILGTMSLPAAAAALSFSRSSSVRWMTLGRRPGSVTLLTVVALETGTLDQRAIGCRRSSWLWWGRIGGCSRLAEHSGHRVGVIPLQPLDGARWNYRCDVDRISLRFAGHAGQIGRSWHGTALHPFASGVCSAGRPAAARTTRYPETTS